MNLRREVEEVIAALDKQRATGFCDEYGILQAWADSLVGVTKSAFGIGHKEAAARAKNAENALKEIVGNPGLSRQKMRQIANNALTKAERLKLDFH